MRGALIARPISLYFASLDENVDGLVELGEVEQGSGQLFAAFDKNADGHWSLVEHGDWSLAHLGSRYALPSGLQTDSDANGRITESEFAGALKAAFDRMDADKDGRLARSEMVIALPTGGHRDPDAMRQRFEEGRRRGDRRR